MQLVVLAQLHVVNC